MDLFLVYLICFGVGLLFAILCAVFAEGFSGHDVHSQLGAHGHAEGGFDHSDMPGFSVLSPTTIASFVTAFGGFGMILMKFPATQSPWISAPLAVFGGVIIAGLVVVLFRSVFRHTQSSSESRVARLPGLPATILTPVPEQGVGEIAYIDGGARYTAPARSEDGAAIEVGRSVVITRVVGSQFFVRPASYDPSPYL